MSHHFKQNKITSINDAKNSIDKILDNLWKVKTSKINKYLSIQNDVNNSPIQIKYEPIEFDTKIQDNKKEFRSSSKIIRFKKRYQIQLRIRSIRRKYRKLKMNTNKSKVIAKSNKKRLAVTLHQEIHNKCNDRIKNGPKCKFNKENMVNYKQFNLNSIQFDSNKHKCDQCEYNCNKSSDLVKHKRIHSGERLFQCNQCEYKCSDPSALSTHRRIHTNEKPFACDQCEKKFTQSSTLVAHKRTHSGERPFECDQCEMKFTKSSNLTVHKRIHSGEKPFKCDQCEFKCTQSSSLVRHKRIHSKETTIVAYKCATSIKAF